MPTRRTRRTTRTTNRRRSPGIPHPQFPANADLQAWAEAMINAVRDLENRIADLEETR